METRKGACNRVGSVVVSGSCWSRASCGSRPPRPSGDQPDLPRRPVATCNAAVCSQPNTRSKKASWWIRCLREVPELDSAIILIWGAGRTLRCLFRIGHGRS